MPRFRVTWFKFACLVACAVTLIAARPPVAKAYINGGDFRHDFEEQKGLVSKGGWRVAFAAPKVAEGDRHFAAKMRQSGTATTVIPDPKNQAEFSRWVKQLVARAIAELPKDEATRFTPELRDQLVVTAQEQLAAALGEKPPLPTVRVLGPFECKAGAFDIHSWWFTNYKGGVEAGPRIHAEKKAGICPFVAVRLIPEKSERVGTSTP